jgi:ABC-type antimicrobial peptide transport system permease subunit
MRDVWRALPGTTSDGRSGSGDSISDVIEFIVALPFLLIAAAGLAFSLVDLVFQLIALPFALLSRLVRLTGWPVQLDRADKFVRTERVKGFVRAGTLRDEQVALVGAGQVTAPAA